MIKSLAVARASFSLPLLNSAIANAKNNFQLEESNLYISRITVDEGPKYKRWRARARGRASEIQKKTSHVNLYLDEIVKKPKKVKKGKKVEEVEKIEKVPKIEKPKFRPEKEIPRPKIEKDMRRIFRRKAF